MQRSLESRCREVGGIPGDRVSRLDILAVASYTGQQSLIAAERVFDIAGTRANRVLRPRSFAAVQVRSMWQRRQIQRLMVDEMRNGPPGP